MNIHEALEDVCVWECPSCHEENVEYFPFPVIAICSECNKENSNYCSHKMQQEKED